jgi:hypothetical protein
MGGGDRNTMDFENMTMPEGMTLPEGFTAPA